MKKFLIIALILLAIGAIAAFMVYKYVYNKPHPDYETKKSDLSIEAKRLWTDFSMNKDIADGKYTGKVLQIDGIIMRVEEAEGMVIVVFAYRKGDFGDEGVRVTMLPNFADAAKHIDPFKPVKIKGLCTGYNGTDVILENGSIVGTQQ
jgi:hypothetical protein